jgi:hypothetical protein
LCDQFDELSQRFVFGLEHHQLQTGGLGGGVDLERVVGGGREVLEGETGLDAAEVECESDAIDVDLGRRF